MKASVVEVSCYLVVSMRRAWQVGGNEWRGEAGPIRVSKGKPSTGANEIAIALKLELPIALFQRPDLTANIVVPPERAPFVITPDVQENIAEQIREQTGFTVRIEAAASKEEQ